MDKRGEKDRSGVLYSKTFKQTMVRKLAGPGRRTATELSKEVGVPQPTLSRWLRAAGSVRGMTSEREQDKAQRRPQDWTAEERLAAVLEAESLSQEELGEFLRRKGLHEAQLKEWRELALAALGARKATATSRSEAKRVRELEKELRRKDKALAETAALLVLKKKLQALWGDEDDDTERKNGK